MAASTAQRPDPRRVSTRQRPECTRFVLVRPEQRCPNRFLHPSRGYGGASAPTIRWVPEDRRRRVRSAVSGMCGSGVRVDLRGKCLAGSRRTPLREAGEHPIARGPPRPVSMAPARRGEGSRDARAKARGTCARSARARLPRGAGVRRLPPRRVLPQAGSDPPLVRSPIAGARARECLALLRGAWRLALGTTLAVWALLEAGCWLERAWREPRVESFVETLRAFVADAARWVDQGGEVADSFGRRWSAEESGSAPGTTTIWGVQPSTASGAAASPAAAMLRKRVR